MEQIRKLIRQYIFELHQNNLFGITSSPGEYSTEEMNYFMLKLFDLIFYSNKPEVYEIKKSISIPSSWPASSVSNTGEEAIQNWEQSTKNYADLDTKWYVWKADIGGNLNKPRYLSPQRIDFESILDIVSKNPESFRNMSIGVTNKRIEKLDNGIPTKGD